MQIVLVKILFIRYNNTHGGIAQLGERLNGIQEVMGSNPTISMEIGKFWTSGLPSFILPDGEKMLRLSAE